MAGSCGAFCCFCGRCGRKLPEEMQALKPKGVAPPGVTDEDAPERKNASSEHNDTHSNKPTLAKGGLHEH